MSATNKKGLVYNLTGRPLRARYRVRAGTRSFDIVQDLNSLGADGLPDAVPFGNDACDKGRGNIERDLLPDADAARCIGCHVDLGEANARQYCGKTHCPFLV
nr:hypothetical protein [Pandoravirus massiliensis]